MIIAILLNQHIFVASKLFHIFLDKVQKYFQIV